MIIFVKNIVANINVYNDAEKILNKFLLNKITSYSQYRNFDFGLSDPYKAVSGLSPYISRGIIKEQYILKKVKENKNTSDKFIQEVLWRSYWKGWLEMHNKVWLDYKSNVDYQIMKIYKSDLYEIYNNALKGQTDLEPFDKWIIQLKKTGYLHNHSRMWFASIWIHYFGLPWELGANFFYENLLDADAASNTLSWKWVAGIQTLGKKYIATKENIMKYSLTKYKDFILPKLKDINLDYKTYEVNKINYNKKAVINKSKKNALFVLENNLNFNFVKNNLNKELIVILLRTDCLSIKKNIVSRKFQDHCNLSFLDLCKKYKIVYKTFDISKSFVELVNYLLNEHIYYTYSEYIPIGYERDLMMKLILKLNGSKINYTDFLDSFYQDVWNYCDKGFFQFKKKFNRTYT
tara:strand:- start:2031 stop:3245 length:1215 start_codon:yes stop_codon:yes gene_type:complete